MKKENIKEWAKAAGMRALKTVAEVALSMMTVGQAFTEIDWLHVVSVSATAGIISLLLSIKGLPELKNKQEE